MSRKKTIFIYVLLATLATAFSCKTLSDKKTIKLAHGLDESHPVHKAMVYMGEILKKKSNGKIEIKIYPAGQLGNEREFIELLQIGSIDMTKVSAVSMEGFAEEYKVLGLPFIFKNKEHAFGILDSAIGKKILLSGQDSWLRGLCYFDAGARSFYTIDKPVNSPDDLKGIKIRVMKSITAMNMIEAMGGSPTPIAWGELYTALQSRVVDGAENNPPSFYLSRHYEICKYYSLDEHTMVPDVLIASTHFWEKLNEDEKKWLQEAADEASKYQRKLWAISEKETLEKIQEAGVKISYPDKTSFEKISPQIFESFKSNPKIYNLIQEIKHVN